MVAANTYTHACAHTHTHNTRMHINIVVNFYVVMFKCRCSCIGPSRVYFSFSIPNNIKTHMWSLHLYVLAIVHSQLYSGFCSHTRYVYRDQETTYTTLHGVLPHSLITCIWTNSAVYGQI